jgi:hypothetical protein
MAVEKTFVIKVDTKGAVKSVDNLNKEIESTTESTEQFEGVIGQLDKMTGGLASGFTGLGKGLKKVTGSFKTMRGAIIATGLGALVLAVGALASAFTSSEEGQNKFNKMMLVIGSVVTVFTDKLADLGMLLINVFTNPIESLKSFGTSIKTFVMDKFDAVMKSVGLLGSAISKLFSGDFSGAFEDAKDGVIGLNNELNPAVILINGVIAGTKKLTQASKELAKQIADNARSASAIADKRAQADKLERDLILENAEAIKKRAELLNKAIDKEKFSLQERIDFLKEAGTVEDEIVNKQLTAAKLRLAAQVAENKLGKSTKDDLKKEIQLKANIIALESARLLKAREVSAQIIGLNTEAKAAEEAATNEKIAQEKALQDFKDGLRIKDKENKFADIEQERADRIKALEELKLDKETEQQMLIDVEQAFKEKKKIIEEEEKVIADEKLAAFLESELQKKELTLEEQKNEALAEVTRLNGTEEDKMRIRKKFADEETKIEGIKRDAEVDMAKSTFAGIANLLGENSKAGKAAAAAAALINTYQGITAELATKTVTPFGFALKLVNIASTAAIGFKSVKSILATNPKAGGGSATNPASGAASASPSAIPEPPAFNVVGASETNQLADAIGGQASQPVQAFVVSSDVTTSQSLDRNIVTSATIG